MTTLKTWLTLGTLSVAWGLIFRYGIPLLWDWLKEKLPPLRQRMIGELIPEIVDIIEVIGEYEDWPGETKLREALRRLEDVVGGMDETEEKGATAGIDAVVNVRSLDKPTDDHAFAKDALERLFG